MKAPQKKERGEVRNEPIGTLYVVSTPLGNLEDITLRALKILKTVDLIAAESVQHTRRLCQHFGIKTRLIRYNQHNGKVRGPELIKRLKEGLDVALVTNAGTPGISDPGVFLVSQALREQIRVSPIPGPSAVTAALSVAGLRGDGFVFLGFLSNRSSKRKQELKGLLSESRTLVFFEAPHRLQAMLSDLKEILGNRQIVLLREMTKLFEELKGGSISSILDRFQGEEVRGEFTVVVAGKEKIEGPPSLDEKIQRRIRGLLDEHKMSVKDMARQLSAETGVAFRDLYKAGISVKRAMEPS
ncbi:MAG: 16S rRNA (cytidine(1402)-2'-O)-methyltransferase [Desulfobacterales bacterium]|nr:16S rRNA (cytidine(1402)-2'-O)-methyltransferase [Desulfobacterales bacterium]